MNRKLTTVLLGMVTLLFVFTLSQPASALFTQDTMTLNLPNGDTSSATGTNQRLDVATDSSGNAYVLHVYNNGTDTQALRVTILDKLGKLVSVVTVDTYNVQTFRKTAIAVNRTSGGIYVAVADSTGARIYADADGRGDGNTDFESAAISGFGLANMTENFGFIDVTVFGSGATDSVFVIGTVDSAAAFDRMIVGDTTIGVGDTFGGVRLWRFRATGGFKHSDSVIVVHRNDTGRATDSQFTPLTAGLIPSYAALVPLSPNSVGAIFSGVILNLVGNGLGAGFDSVLINGSVRVNSLFDTAVDTGFFYDTFHFRHDVNFAGHDGAYRMGVESDTGFSQIVSGIATLTDSEAVATALFDNTNSRVVLYYKQRGASSKLRRATMTGGATYAAGNDADVGSNISVSSNDSALVAIAAALDDDGNEIVILRSATKIHYVKRAAGTSSTNLDFDTVVQPPISASTTDSPGHLGVYVTSLGEARVFYSDTVHNERFINIGKPGVTAAAPAADAGVSVVAAVEVTTTTTPTLTVDPPASDTNELTQVSLALSTATTVTAGSLQSSFSSPTYTLTAPLANATGDTLVAAINSISPGVAIYIRRFVDTTPSGGNNAFDTDVFGGGLSDSQITLLMESAVVIRAGDTAGLVYAEGRSFAETLAIRFTFQHTPAQLNRLNAAGVDTTNLSCWKATLSQDGGKLSTTNDFTQIGHVTNSVNHQSNTVSVVCNPVTTLSGLLDAPGLGSSGSGGGGVCVITKFVDGSSRLASSFRGARDFLLSTKLGRVLTSFYYGLN